MGMIFTRTSYKPKRKSKKVLVDVAKKAPKRAFVEKKPRVFDTVAPSHDGYKSKIDEYLETTGASFTNSAPKYDGDLAARELLAQEESERRKKCVAPAYNKGAYTYIASEEQAKWVGRK